MRRRGRLLVVAAVMTALAACATPAVNAKLDRQDPAVGYRYANLTADGDNGDDLFVILAFSGGGTRAAAFSFGVMEGLREVTYGSGRTSTASISPSSSTTRPSSRGRRSAIW